VQPKKVRQKDQLAKRHTANIAAFFRYQKTLVMRKLAGRSLSAPLRRAGRELEIVKVSPDAWTEIWNQITKQTTPTLKEVIVSAEADGLHAGANNFPVTGLFDKKTTFNLANPRAVAWFHERGGSVDYIAGIQQKTGEQIKTIITDALKAGQAYTKTAKQISDAFDGMSRERAQRIAVYETAQAYEQGNMLFAQSLKDDGIEMEKMYQTSEDALVSDLCQGNQDEGWIPIDQYHRSGVQEPPGHVNCRCFEKYRQKTGSD